MVRDKHLFHQRLHECLGRIIFFRRKRLGLSQVDLAKKANIDRSFLSKVEHGKRSPSFGLVSEIAYGLKMSYSRLVQKCEKCADGE